jgi:predicted component of type VI protein secretion system
MTILHLAVTPWHLVTSAATWHLRSQQHATSNALAASTSLAQRRREIEEVEEFLAHHASAVPWAG